jgi:subtilisin family serine protease
MERTYYVGDTEQTLEQLEDVIAIELGDESRAERAEDFGEILALDEEVRGENLDVDEEQLGAFTTAGWVFVRPTEETDRAVDRGETPAGAQSAGRVYRTDEGRLYVLTDRLTVRLAEDLSGEKVTATLDDAGLEVIQELTFAPNLYEVRVTGDADPLDVSVELHDDQRFVYADPNFVEHIPGRFTPSDPDYDQQWQWENDGSSGGTTDADVNAEGAWEHTRGAGTRVAVIDNGIDVTHPDLAAAVAGAGYFQSTPGGGASFVSGTAGFPGGNHGTFCSGMAVARAENAEGGVGAANEATFTPVACLGDQVGSQTTLARAVAYAADPSREIAGASAADGADVISCSLGPNNSAWTMQTVLRDAIDFAVGSGRGGLGTPVFWATDNASNPVAQDQVCAYANTIAVGRSDNDDDADGSASGPELDFLAPGVDVYSTTGGGGYGTGTGTSYATPLSAGVGALVIGVDPDLTWDEVRQVLRDTCEKVGGVTYGSDGHHDDYGFGRINATDAVCRALRGVELDTSPTLTFNDVPEDRTTVRAARFSVTGCETVTLQVVSGPTLTSGDGAFSLPLGSTVTVSPAGATPETARVWVAYSASGAAPGDTATGTVTVRDIDTGAEWTLSLTASVIERETVAVDLVLDRSDSMSWDSGVETVGGAPIDRMSLLQFSAPMLVELLEEDDAIGAVQFNQDAQPATTNIEAAGPAPFGSGRTQAKTAIGNLSPAGSTSIGDGVELAHSRLGGVSGYDNEAIVVFSDGHENQPKYLSDVSGLIDETVFAIGLGTPEKLRPAALDALANGTGGYVVLTDELGSDDNFLLAKYFMQVLAGVKNNDVVVDPDSRLKPGESHRIPFRVTEADVEVDVAVVGPQRNLFRLSLETPTGDAVDTGTASTNPEVSYVVAENVTYYRLNPPVALGGGPAGRGQWHAVLELDEKYYQRYLTRIEEQGGATYEKVRVEGVHYNLGVYTDSDITMATTLSQDSYEPGATLTLRTVLEQYGAIPVTDATVEASVTMPDGSTTTVTLDSVADGAFETAVDASATGTYRFHVRARGRSLRGTPFTREQIRTAGVWQGGDEPAPTDASDPRVQGELLCELLECLSTDAFAEAMEEWGVDPDAVRRCVERYCERLEATGQQESSTASAGGRPPWATRPVADFEGMTIADFVELPAVKRAIERKGCRSERTERGR